MSTPHVRLGAGIAWRCSSERILHLDLVLLDRSLYEMVKESEREFALE